MTAPSSAPFVLVRAAGRVCALPLAHVVETMRPMPVERVAGAPPFVAGLAIVRGAPLPVVDLARCLGGEAGRATRFVTIAVASRRVALAVEAVVGVRALDQARLDAVPPLLREAAASTVDLVGALDPDLLVVLRVARVMPDEAWRAFDAAGARS